MRIWTTFTAIILIIIFSISIFYLVAFRTITETGITQALKVSHEVSRDILLKASKFTAPNRFDELRNLKDSDYYIVTKDKKDRKSVV